MESVVVSVVVIVVVVVVEAPFGHRCWVLFVFHEQGANGDWNAVAA